MARNPKIEVYKISLNPNGKHEKTFRDFFVETLDEDDLESEDNNYLFLEFFRKFITQIDTNDFISNQQSKKAFTAYDTSKEDDDNSTIKPASEQEIIYGVIEGGKYGAKRNKSSLNNKADKEGLSKDDIILDQFYFCIHLPFNFDTGILFIQSYSSDTVSNDFSNFLCDFFRAKSLYKKAKKEKFVPKTLIKEFEEKSIVKKFSYSTKHIFDQLDGVRLNDTEQEFTVKVEITASNGIQKESLTPWRRIIGGKLFDQLKLSNFNKGKVYLKNTDTEKETPFELDQTTFDISPAIYLQNRVILNEDESPDLDDLHKYCMRILNLSIIPEIFPEGVQER